MPRRFNPHAASRPSRPPPITTARRSLLRAPRSSPRHRRCRGRRAHWASRRRELAAPAVSIRWRATVCRKGRRSRRRASTRRAARSMAVARFPVNQANAMLAVPAPRVDDDFVERLVARQDRRQQDAVVVRLRFGADDGDVETVGSARQQLLDRPHPGHAVADDHEPRAPAVAHVPPVFGRGAAAVGFGDHELGKHAVGRAPRPPRARAVHRRAETAVPASTAAPRRRARSVRASHRRPRDVWRVQQAAGNTASRDCSSLFTTTASVAISLRPCSFMSP